MNLIVLALTLALAGSPIHLTPGALCTPANPDFDGYRYPAKIAHCARNLTSSVRAAVAKAYGIGKTDWSKYKFDHRIPLSLGGSNEPANVWPQPSAQAAKKDALEEQLYLKLSKGLITQKAAVRLMLRWRPGK